MDVVQGHIHDHLTIMPPVLQIISSISVVIWLERVQSWIFNPTPTPPPRTKLLYVAIALSLKISVLCLVCLLV